MPTITFETTMHLIACPECGMSFGMPTDYYERRQHDHKQFYCPSGHSQYFPQESDLDKLQKQLKAARREAREAEQRLLAERDQREAGERVLKQTRKQLAGVKSAHTRLKNRIANGICPCCRRSFQNLHEHMQDQHPDYVEQENDL